MEVSPSSFGEHFPLTTPMIAGKGCFGSRGGRAFTLLLNRLERLLASEQFVILTGKKPKWALDCSINIVIIIENQFFNKM
jgi:hypothetical protein